METTTIAKAICQYHKDDLEKAEHLLTHLTKHTNYAFKMPNVECEVQLDYNITMSTNLELPWRLAGGRNYESGTIAALEQAVTDELGINIVDTIEEAVGYRGLGLVPSITLEDAEVVDVVGP